MTKLKNEQRKIKMEKCSSNKLIECLCVFSLLLLMASDVIAGTADDYVKSGKAKIDAGKTQEAMEDFRKAFKEDPNNAGACYFYATILIHQKNPVEAKIYIDRYVQLEGYNIMSYYLLGQYDHVLGNYDLECENYSKIISLNPEVATTYIDRGKAYMLLVQNENALKDFNKALALEPENAKAYLYRGTLWQEQGKTKEAMKDYDKALELNPSYADVFFLRAGLWEQKKQPSRAIKDYTKAIELNPEKSKYYTARAQLWMTNEKDVKKGIADLKKALEIEPNDARSCFQLGLLLNFQGEQVNGMDYLYKAGNIFAENKNRNGLITVIEEMAKINPKSPLVQQLYKLAYPDIQPGDSTFYNDELSQNDVSRTAVYDDDDDDEDYTYKGSTTSKIVGYNHVSIAPDGSYVYGRPQIAPDGSYVGGTPKITPDGSYVGGGKVNIAPDGSYVGGKPQITPDGGYVGGKPHITPSGGYVGDGSN